MANQARPGPREGGSPVSALLRRPAVRRSAAVAGLALIGSGVYLGGSRCSGAPPPPAAPPTNPVSTAPTISPLTGVGTAGRVLTVKIDNVGAAQYQQTGL